MRNLKHIALSCIFLGGLFLESCKVGPDFIRPDFKETPNELSDGRQIEDSSSIADIDWKVIFHQPELIDLIEIGLINNYDLNIAVQRVIEAQGFVTRANARLIPFLNYEASAGYTWISEDLLFGGSFEGTNFRTEFAQFSLAALLSYEVDIWGKIRRFKESRIAELLNAEATRQTIITTLIAEIATAYFDILVLKEKIEIVQKNIDLREATYDLIKLQNEKGTASGVSLEFASSEYHDAKAQKPELVRLLRIRENTLNLLLGRYPTTIYTNGNASSYDPMVYMPTGVPSQLLDNRPDLIAAEMTLKAKNARVGVAKAAFYPSFNINADIGFGASDFTRWFQPSSLFASAVGGLVGPIFRAGSLKARLKIAEAKNRGAYLEYQKVVNTAFVEVRNTLISINQYDIIVRERNLAAQALIRSVEYANLLYRGGVIGYLDVIFAQRLVLEAELAALDSKRDQIVSIILLYKALGGGWK